MLGRRDPQRSLFEAHAWPQRVPEDSFYARMGAVQDTYTLIRKGIRRVLKVAGYHLPAKKRGLSADLAAYLGRDRKADLDWADPTARAAQLKILVRDAEATLNVALQQADDAHFRALHQQIFLSSISSI